MKKQKPVNQDTNLNIRISSDITDAFRKLAAEKSTTASKLYREALIAYLNSQGVKL